jgi:hypothetical protein
MTNHPGERGDEPRSLTDDSDQTLTSSLTDKD